MRRTGSGLCGKRGAPWATAASTARIAAVDSNCVIAVRGKIPALIDGQASWWTVAVSASKNASLDGTSSIDVYVNDVQRDGVYALGAAASGGRS